MLRIYEKMEKLLSSLIKLFEYSSDKKLNFHEIMTKGTA